MNTKSILISIILLVSLVAAVDLSKYNLKANESYIYIHRVTAGTETYPNAKAPDADPLSTDWNYNTEILLRGYLKNTSFSLDDYPTAVANYFLENATVTWSINKISHSVSSCTNTNTVKTSGTEKLENLQFMRDIDPDGTIIPILATPNIFPFGTFNLRLYDTELDSEGNPMQYEVVPFPLFNPNGIGPSESVPLYQIDTAFIIPADVVWTTNCHPAPPVSEIYDPNYFFAPIIDILPLNTNIINGSMNNGSSSQWVFKDPRTNTFSQFGFWEETVDEPYYEMYEDPFIWYVEWKMYVPNMPVLNASGNVNPNTPPENGNTSGNTPNNGNNTDDGNNTDNGNNTDSDNDPCDMKDCTFSIPSPGSNGTTDVIVSDPNGPVSDASVTVVDSQGNEKTYITDNNGVAHINFNAGSGNYTLSAGNKTINYQPPRQLFDDPLKTITDSSGLCLIMILIIIIILVAIYLRLRRPQQLPPKTK